MLQFRPFHPLILAIAQELQRRADEQLDANPLESLKAILEERPLLDVDGHATLAAQINDLMGISQPSDDRMRLALMLFLPRRRGSLFTVNEVLMHEAILSRYPLLASIATRLGKGLDEQWGEVIRILQTLPAPPVHLVSAGGVPIEAQHPAAKGPLPADIQQFMRPDGE